jgi:acetyl esterase
MKKYEYTKELKGPYINTGKLKINNPILKLYYNLGPLVARTMRPPKNTFRQIITLPGENNNPIDCFVITPYNASKESPTIIYLHGGGFYIGTNPLCIAIAGYLAKKLKARVFIPEYRTSFLYKYPTPVEDCYSATKELLSNPEKYNTNPDKVVLYGDSAGGCLAAATSIMARDRKEFSVHFQMLIYPVTDYLMRGESFKLFPDAPWSTKNNIEMWDTYLGDKVPEKLDYASPLCATDLSNLPPSYIEPQGIDTLRDDGILYAEKLVKFNNQVELNIIPGSYHGFELEFNRPLTQQILAHRVEVIKKHFEKA